MPLSVMLQSLHYRYVDGIATLYALRARKNEG